MNIGSIPVIRCMWLLYVVACRLELIPAPASQLSHRT
jgi:hypothetical protein